MGINYYGSSSRPSSGSSQPKFSYAATFGQTGSSPAVDRSTGIADRTGGIVGKSTRISTAASAVNLANSSKERSVPERLDLNSLFNDVTGPNLDNQDQADFLASLGQIPAQTYERPLAVANVLTGSKTTETPAARVFGQNVRFGKSQQGFIDQVASGVGKVPVLGDVLGGAGNVLTAASNLAPAQQNQRDLGLLLANKNLPDSTPLSSLPGGQGLIGSVFGGTAGTGIDFLAQQLGFEPKTLGDFRKQMAKRGFSQSDFNEIAAGKKTLTDYGSRPVSDNALLDLGFRVSTDPTNLLFVAGGPLMVAKGLLKGAGLADRLVASGKMLPEAVSAVQSAKAISEGNTAAATLAGLGTYISKALSVTDHLPSLGTLTRDYTKLSVATQAVTGAANLGSDWLTKNAPEGPWTPALQGLHDLSQQILDNKPLSSNAGFQIIAAYSFPLHEAAAVIKKPIDVGFRLAKGGGGLTAALADQIAPSGLTFAEKKKWLADSYGGDLGVKRLANYIDNTIAHDYIGLHPALLEPLASIDEAGARTVQFQRAIADQAARMRADGRITNDLRISTYKEWFGHQAGLGSEFRPADAVSRFQQPWDPHIAAETWNRYSDVMVPIGETLINRGDAAVGLQDMIYAEHVDQVRSLFNAEKSGGTVPFATFQEIVNRYPQLVINDTTGYWEQALATQKPVPMASLTAKLNSLAHNAPKLETLTAEPAAMERAAPQVPDVPVGNMTDSAVVQPNGNGPLSPAFADNVLGQGSPARTPVDGGSSDFVGHPAVEDTAPLRYAEDATVLGPQQAAVDAERDAAAAQAISDQTGLAWGSRNALDAGKRADLADLQKFVQQFPGYRIVNAPNLAHFLSDAPTAIADSVLRSRGLWEWLNYSGPTAPLARAIEMLADKPTPRTMAGDAKQALYNELLPHGATPKQVDRWVSEISRYMNKSTIKGVRVFRTEAAVLPSVLKDLAETAFGPTAAPAIEKAIGGWDRALDRAHNRVYQAAVRAADSTLAPSGGHSNVLTVPVKKIGPVSAAVPGLGVVRDFQHFVSQGAKGELARAAEGVYTKWQASGLGAAQRMGTKILYPIMRFLGDPRWWLMNEYEQDTLGLLKYGMGSTRFGAQLPETPANVVHDPRYGSVQNAKIVADASKRIADGEDAGLPFSHRHAAAIVNNTFEKDVRESIDRTLNALNNHDPVFGDLAMRFGADPTTWAQGIYDTLYNLDSKGAKAAITDEAKAAGVYDAKLAPFYDRLYEIHTQAMKDLRVVMEGNASRTNLERVLNHPLLYWPLSYQLKATKWLFDVMTDRSFGHQTNFGGAYTLAHVEDIHKKEMATNPSYAAIFSQHPALWQMAQQLVPITPWDLGVSLSRPVRYVGGWLGVWGGYKAASTPQAAIQAVTQIGPIYSAKLLKDTLDEFGLFGGKPSITISVPKPKSAATH